jgi:uncharacterized protein (DUF1778 family)
MVRPKKDPKLVKGVDLRIPVTPEQKELITRAAADVGSDMAPWAREILLQAASGQLGERKATRQRGQW